MNWQPIETAPKDGTRILLFNSYQVRLGYWGGKRPACWKEDSGRSLWGAPPTHWMPLPAPPTNSKGA